MKINGTDTNQLPGIRESYARQVGDKTESANKVTPQTSDSVRISSDAKEALRMMGEVQKVPDVREEKVRELQALISSGTYSVSGEQVAESMIKETMLGTIL